MQQENGKHDTHEESERSLPTDGICEHCTECLAQQDAEVVASAHPDDLPRLQIELICQNWQDYTHEGLVARGKEPIEAEDGEDLMLIRASANVILKIGIIGKH
jgi:hypothetical protein